MPDQIKAKVNRKRHKSSTLVRTRRWVQALALIAFVLTLLFTRLDGLQAPVSNLAVRLSPFAMLASLISSRTFLLGSSAALVLLASSFVVGRAWCGWLCPLGTLLDLFPLARLRKKPLQITEKLRGVKYGILFTALIAAIFSNLTLLFLDPITIATRTFSTAILPGIDHALYWLELQLVNVPVLADGVYKFDQWLRPAIFQSQPAVLLYPGMVLGFFVLLVLLNALAERFWCRYLCPLGAMLGLGAKLAPFKRRVKESCTGCGLCELKCPTGTIDPQRGYGSDPAECTLCFDCQGTCKNSEFGFSGSRSETGLREYDPGRRTFLASIGAVAVGAALVKTKLVNLTRSAFSLRPPGAKEDSLLAACLRCGLCVKVCPTQALQFDPSNSSIDGFMTPIFVPRNGFCDYSCNTCGATCPVQAIPALSLEEKRVTVIGKAVIDHKSCLAWGENTPCFVCEEMCPLPQKAITLEARGSGYGKGRAQDIQVPVVNTDLCIGCGTCEYKCPVAGEAAIRVHTLESVEES